MNKNVNVYAYTKLRSANLDLSKDESYLLSRLVNIESKILHKEIELEDISNEIYRCFEAANLKFKADRVCVSFMTPFSNRMNVLSSHNSDKLGFNLMGPGYINKCVG